MFITVPEVASNELLLLSVGVLINIRKKSNILNGHQLKPVFMMNPVFKLTERPDSNNPPRRYLHAHRHKWTLSPLSPSSMEK